MLPFSGAHAAPTTVGNVGQFNWKYMETDIAFEIDNFVTAQC